MTIAPSPQLFDAIAADIAADGLMARSIAAISLAQSITAWPEPGERNLALPDHTTVYLYRFWDENRSLFVIALREATLDCIRCGLGTPILTSAREVALSDLDDVGRVNLMITRSFSEPNGSPPSW